MDIKSSKRFLLLLAAIYWVLVIIVYVAAGDAFHRTAVTTEALSASNIVGEVIDGVELRQRFTAPAERLDSLELMTGSYGRVNTGTMNLTLTNESNEIVATGSVDISVLQTELYTQIPLQQTAPIQVDETLILSITTSGCMPGNAVTIYTGTTVSTARFDIIQDIEESDRFVLNGETGVGKLCVRLNGTQEITFYRMYWLIVAGVFIVALVLCARWWNMAKKGITNPLLIICTLHTRYGFLMRQLVARDFKAKYKRSMLGMLWSFLNPLLTMVVQYIVFSTLFRSGIENFLVYLLSGIVFWNFFNEAVSLGMMSIVGNASLIKKVYVPKYIYPVTKILSSLINFGLAFIPLMIVILVTGLPLRMSMLLLIFDILCLFGFVMGMVLLLTTAMTFFQDTQFLWGVVSMLWMYLTPLFYPETIILPKFRTLYHINPMYQYITFARTCIIDGISPEPIAYLWCVLSAAIVLLLGILVFKRHQNKFVLQL